MEKELNYIDEIGQQVRLSICNVGKINPKATIQIECEITRDKKRRLFSLSIPADNVHDFLVASAPDLLRQRDALLEACKELVADREMLEQDEAITACQCMSSAPDDITPPLPCAYCQGKAAIALAEPEKGE